jgi:hypothetical protein
MAIKIPRRTLVQLEEILKRPRIGRREQVQLVQIIGKCQLILAPEPEEGC